MSRSYFLYQTTGCPFCGSSKLTYARSLKGGFPKVAAEWHPTKNGSLDPEKIVPRYSKKCWFICDKGHEWQQTPHKRTTTKRHAQCPYCSGLKKSPENGKED